MRPIVRFKLMPGLYMIRTVTIVKNSRPIGLELKLVRSFKPDFMHKIGWGISSSFWGDSVTCPWAKTFDAYEGTRLKRTLGSWKMGLK